MRKAFILFLLSVLLPLMAAGAEMKQNRGLIAFANGNFIQVEWRMRAIDDPTQTQYCLYADGQLYGTFRSKTTARLNKSKYENATFSLVVKDKDGHELDRQEGVKPWTSPYLDIPLTAPIKYSATADTAIVRYAPLDASAYDMDGDGEQEIILKWDVSWAGEHSVQADRHQYVDCYKLNGKRLWRVDFGQNTSIGNNFTFMVWDFDGDGRGEMIVKTAPGTKDATGKYVGKGLKGYEDSLTVYRRGSTGGVTAGEEWITCFDGVTGMELASKQYWPYFSIQSDWNPGGGADGASYGKRGNGFKGAVIKIPCRDGHVRPVCYMQRGIYSFVYATAISWNGTSLVVGFVFGSLIDLNMLLTSWLQPVALWQQALAQLAGCTVLGVGIALEVRCGSVTMPGEGLPVAISRVSGVDFARVKICVDVSLVVLGVSACYGFFGAWQWHIVGVGTLFAMFYVGMVVRTAGRHLRWFERLLAYQPGFRRYIYGLARYIYHARP